MVKGSSDFCASLVSLCSTCSRSLGSRPSLWERANNTEPSTSYGALLHVRKYKSSDINSRRSPRCPLKFVLFYFPVSFTEKIWYEKKKWKIRTTEKNLIFFLINSIFCILVFFFQRDFHIMSVMNIFTVFAAPKTKNDDVIYIAKNELHLRTMQLKWLEIPDGNTFCGKPRRAKKGHLRIFN